MPTTWIAEAAQVETIARDLRQAVVGRTITRTEVLLPAAVRFPTADEFTTLPRMTAALMKSLVLR